MNKYLNVDKRKSIFKAFIHSQFPYCPIVWMFHDKNVEHKMNRLHERFLRIVHRDDNSTFKKISLSILISILVLDS